MRERRPPAWLKDYECGHKDFALEGSFTLNRSFLFFLLLLLLFFYKDPLLDRSRAFLVRHFVCCVAVKLRIGDVTSMP